MGRQLMASAAFGANVRHTVAQSADGVCRNYDEIRGEMRSRFENLQLGGPIAIARIGRIAIGDVGIAVKNGAQFVP